jgi:hypothetical protein
MSAAYTRSFQKLVALSSIALTESQVPAPGIPRKAQRNNFPCAEVARRSICSGACVHRCSAVRIRYSVSSLFLFAHHPST